MSKICIIGLGYVGLPILLRLSNNYNCIGYDNNLERIRELKKGQDKFKEFKRKELTKKSILYSSSLKDIKNCKIFIITVPTPIYKNKKPDLSHLQDVCSKISKIIKKNDIIVFESTVYPGLTNNFCIPILEKKTKFIEGKDFFVGYSPERVNPGDKNHSLKKINKILAYPHTYKKKEIIKLYSELGKKIFFTKKIREAETAKVIENIQRDVNIGLINEIYLACKKMKINFKEVMSLASTKWNFIRFEPGLVGGHCLPVDPYYFSYISKKNKVESKITLAGRSINDSMEDFVYKRILDKIKKFKKRKILICGLTYKQNVSDLRNSLAFSIFKKLKKNKPNIFGYDPLLSDHISKKFNIINRSKYFKNFDIYIPITNHKKIKESLQKLISKKIIVKIF